VAVLFDSDADLLVFHAYDGTTGKPFLQISTMVLGGRLAACGTPAMTRS
jgi:hypothetical protein